MPGVATKTSVQDTAVKADILQPKVTVSRLESEAPHGQAKENSPNLVVLSNQEKTASQFDQNDVDTDSSYSSEDDESNNMNDQNIYITT